MKKYYWKSFFFFFLLPFGWILFNFSDSSLAQDREVYFDLFLEGSSDKLLDFYDDVVFWRGIDILTNIFKLKVEYWFSIVLLFPLIFIFKNLNVNRNFALFIFFVFLDRFFLAGFLNTSRSFLSIILFFNFFIYWKYANERILALIFLFLSFGVHSKTFGLIILFFILSNLLTYIIQKFSYPTKVKFFKIVFIILIFSKFFGLSLYLGVFSDLEIFFKYQSLGSNLKGNYKILIPLLMFIAPFYFKNKGQAFSIELYFVVLFILLLVPEVVFVQRIIPFLILFQWRLLSDVKLAVLAPFKLIYFILFFFF